MSYITSHTSPLRQEKIKKVFKQGVEVSYYNLQINVLLLSVKHSTENNFSF